MTLLCFRCPSVLSQALTRASVSFPGRGHVEQRTRQPRRRPYVAQSECGMGGPNGKQWDLGRLRPVCVPEKAGCGYELAEQVHGSSEEDVAEGACDWSIV